MFKRPALFVSLVVVLVLSGLALGCNGDDDDGEAQSEIEETVRRLSAAGPDDVDFFLNHVTDGFLETFVGVSSEECRANAEQCVGEPDEAVAVQNTSVDGDRATTDVTFGDGFEARLQMVREDGVWKLDEFTSIPREIPEGVTRVDLEMGEFYFDFDEAEVRDGDFAFVTNNAGDQMHHVIVERVPEDADIEAALEAGEPPEGTEEIAFAGPWQPGEEGTVVFDEPLEPGRYVLLCFLPDEDDPEGTPHALLGMWAEFTVE